MDRGQTIFRMASAEGGVRRALMQCGSRAVPVVLVRNRRARRYVLRVRSDGTARVTVPWGGTVQEGLEFARRQAVWVMGQIERLAQRQEDRRDWRAGHAVYYRGQPHPLTLVREEGTDRWVVGLAGERIVVPDPEMDLRPWVQEHLWGLARIELPGRTESLATAHGLEVACVTVRNQRTRWGACSPRGTISLNWRLVQMPDAIGDYVILHELMHLRHLNHSAAFWREVAAVCPDYLEAKRWLRRHQSVLE